MHGSYLGPAYNKSFIKNELQKLGANYKFFEKKQMLKSVAKNDC